ncbi:MAG: hypothetical protein M5U28_14580 [Sandaracinaceae bacterium]|nr:hypothetical protein [Sandaracinaceae bacterium]
MRSKPNDIGFARFLLQKRFFWIHFLIVAAISAGGVTYLGVETYRGAPPIGDFVSDDGETVIPLWQIERGKEVFHLRGLMSYGSFWGDGAERGPDFTADALHRTAESMIAFYERERGDGPVAQHDRDAIEARVRREIRANGWSEEAGQVRINDAQVRAYRELVEHVARTFTDPDYPHAFPARGYITDPDDMQALAAYFFWGGWVAGAARPGADYSYTHNWPYDPLAGNTPTSSTVLWSIISILALFLGIGAVLYVYGQMKTAGDPFESESGAGRRTALTTPELESGDETVRPSQRLVYKFFAFAMIVFLVQVLAGVLSAESFVRWGPGSALLGALGVEIPITRRPKLAPPPPGLLVLRVLDRLHGLLPASTLEARRRTEGAHRPSVRPLRAGRRGRPGRHLPRSEGLPQRRDGLLVREPGLGVHGARALLADRDAPAPSSSGSPSSSVACGHG